ncbi:MAG TPA: metallophosphoesterase [Bacillota bacterium]|nr:metallophosphoesterase [Bacillota bacterium]HPT87028.1 metallophosphoesterase [Bacillota bacterium]
MLRKFIHCSDLHIGRQRLEGKLPESDLAKAFSYIVRYTIEYKADGLLIAGDLFDSPSIQPPHLQMVVECLAPLKEAGIPVFAIEGNHDRPSLSSAMPTWVRYLNDQGYLHLLTIPFTADGPEITPWDPETRRGSYMDYQGIRIVGAGYLGAGTARRMKAIADVLERLDEGQAHPPTLMLLHAGPEYIVRETGGYDQESLDFIRNVVDFIALGHIHKPLHHGWAVNPGTAENIRLEEAGNYKNPVARGMAEIIVDLSGSEPVFTAEILPVPRRPVVNVDFDCTSLSGRNLADKIHRELLEYIRTLNVAPETVLRVYLTGSLNLARAGLDPAELAAFLEEQVPVIAADIVLTQLNQPLVAELAEEAEDLLLSRENIERQAFTELLHDISLPGLDDEAVPKLVQLLMDLKEDVRQEASAEEILDRINRHPVTDHLARKLTEEREREQSIVEVAAGGERDDH